MQFPVYITGLLTGLGLIVAIGAQNVFVLRQGLRGEHVFAVCLLCAVADSVLILVGVIGFERIASAMPGIDPILRYGGAAFLFFYGARSLYSAFRSTEALTASGAERTAPLAETLLACLALTLLNPHVYLDTVVLLGAVSTRFPGAEAQFAAGAITGSFSFFFALGYGAARLRPFFARPAACRALEGAIAAIMWTIALSLIVA